MPTMSYRAKAAHILPCYTMHGSLMDCWQCCSGSWGDFKRLAIDVMFSTDLAIANEQTVAHVFSCVPRSSCC